LFLKKHEDSSEQKKLDQELLNDEKIQASFAGYSYNIEEELIKEKE
jgi:hypothetical protein